jgi:hypothetical protein
VSNLDCMPKDSSANPCGKGNEVSLLGGFIVVVVNLGVDATFSGIVGPVGLCRGLALVFHCCSGNRCTHSVKTILDHRAEYGWTLFKGRFLGNG